MKFSQTISNDDQRFTAVKSIEMVLDDDATLPDVLEAFGQFLRGVGYSFSGEIEVVEPVKDEDGED
jgi:hypothetical protein